MQGPFEIDVKVHIAVGESRGVVTYTLPVGIYPTREAVETAVAAALEGARKQLGEEVRLLTRPEFQDEILTERHGNIGKFACSEDWDA